MSIENGFSKNILNVIKEKSLKPKPKWQFFLKNYVIWGLGIIALIVGGVAFSVVIYLLRYNDWDLYSQMTGSIWKFILLTLPYFWLVLLALFIFTVYYNIKHTKKGYRYPLLATIIVSIILSMLLGVLFFGIGLGQAIDDVLGEKAPFYSKVFNRRPHLWNQPDEGRLAGLIVSKVSNSEYILFDPERQEWNIIADEVTIKPFFEIEVGRPIELIGEKISDNTFRAQRAKPAGSGRRFYMRHRNGDIPESMGHPKMREQMKHNPEFQKRIAEFPQILEKYPELKESFEQDLLERQEYIKEIMENDPEFIKHLERLNIRPEIIDQLQEE